MTRETDLKQIAEFMQLPRQLHLYEHPITGEYVDITDLDYDDDFNMIMPVVQQIGYAGGSVKIKGRIPTVESNGTAKEYRKGPLIENLYWACVDFITSYYNRKKSTQ